MKVLVGFTGFVGSNIILQTDFNYLYNTKNITEAFQTKPDILVYAGIRAEKFLANNYPQRDYSLINEAITNIKMIAPKKIILISTVDVYKEPINVDEDTVINTEQLHPYGINRYYLERWVEDNIKDHLIVRLPGLYGINIKKNFIYDMINIIPTMLNEKKYDELSSMDDYIKQNYIEQGNGFYKCKDLTAPEKRKLEVYFHKINFTALNFTDSRACFQFYNLAYLWEHVQIALNHGIRKINLATEPISAQELYEFVNNNKFVNLVMEKIPHYDYRTKYDYLYSGKNGYIFDKNFVLSDIKAFWEKMRK